MPKHEVPNLVCNAIPRSKSRITGSGRASDSTPSQADVSLFRSHDTDAGSMVSSRLVPAALTAALTASDGSSEGTLTLLSVIYAVCEI